MRKRRKTTIRRWKRFIRRNLGDVAYAVAQTLCDNLKMPLYFIHDTTWSSNAQGYQPIFEAYEVDNGIYCGRRLFVLSRDCGWVNKYGVSWPGCEFDYDDPNLLTEVLKVIQW
jgi:hypothetical protein